MFSRAFFLILCLCCACISAKLCRSVDVRNRVQQFDKLKNCTKIVGYLRILLFQRDGVNFPTFPELKEVTGYVLVFALQNLNDLGVIFPNLVVIRGKSLFNGNALLIHHNNGLKKIGLPNLRQIQRGNVQIGKCPDLCYVRTVNWTALGTSLSSYADVPECKEKEECDIECNGHCWSPRKCQKIYDDCHEECLGCSEKDSAKHCLACKNWIDGDTCVSKCPPNKIMSANMMACVTEEECYNFKDSLNITAWVFQKWCLRRYTCPENYELVSKPVKTCKLCEGPCFKECPGTSINNKQDMQQLRGCTYIKGHLELKVRNEYEVYHLYNLVNVSVINGCLKVARSDSLSSLHFLRNLKQINGVDKHTLCNNHTVYIHDNINLKTLIDVDHIKTDGNISIGFHYNPELCISEIKKFARILGMPDTTFEDILQQEKDVSPDSNGDRAMCGDLKLNVTVAKTYPTNVTLDWEPYSSNDATVIAYTFFYIRNRTLQEENNYNYDNNMCSDNGWRSRLISENTLTITDLQPFSLYAYWIKVNYLKNNRGGSKSTEMKYFETKSDDPTDPIDFNIEPLSPTSVKLTWESPEYINGILNHYHLYAFLEKDDAKFVNERNYCIYPHVVSNVEKIETKPARILMNQTNNGECNCNVRIFKKDSFCGAKSLQFPTKDCNNYLYDLIDKPTKKNKRDTSQVEAVTSAEKMINIEINANKSEHILDNLKPFSRYIFWFSACNYEFGNRSQCSAILFYSVRTLANETADQITRANVKIINDNSVSLTWVDPEKPNGMIVAYNIEYKSADSSSSVNVLDCITRTQHVTSGFVYRIENIDPGTYSIRIRPVSLHGPGIYSPKALFQIKTQIKPWTIYLVICVGFAVIFTSFIYLWYRKKTKIERVYLIPNINPEYSRAVYIEEGWELERDDVDMNEVLGQGSFGVVYSGYIKSKNLPCAVKTINDTTATIHKSEFLKEAFVMKSFNDAHHVIKLFGVVSKDDPPLVIMELMQRGDLKQYLRNARKNPKAISLPEMYQMASQIADGMAYLSAKKYVHRDLAARNCMVAGDRTVKIGDFGMTKDIYETDYYRKGTSGLLPVRWMAPESLADGVFSSESDVWSYGIVLWEMVTLAEHPYQGMSNEQVLKFVTTRGRLGRPKDCPNVLWEIMEACWEHKPSKRPLFIGIVEKLEPLAGQSFPLVSFYHSQAGINHRMNYGRQESVAMNNDAQNSYLERDGDGEMLMDEDEEDYAHHSRNRKVTMVSSDSLTWPSSYSISGQTP
ncbi:insulin-like peptide receptor isoform X2 [Harmonia axyridis]|uniref:insulin-like peptide receptor isoform X2 n=1 Tax=Harmonia axyridis TaxID=115357 RepID=UPI001E275FFA|nr:insulin-like peptide receptor isoform X2 [Harmonia axyridis]